MPSTEGKTTDRIVVDHPGLPCSTPVVLRFFV
jgi:hypothetical protein